MFKLHLHDINILKNWYFDIFYFTRWQQSKKTEEVNEFLGLNKVNSKGGDGKKGLESALIKEKETYSNFKVDWKQRKQLRNVQIKGKQPNEVYL